MGTEWGLGRATPKWTGSPWGLRMSKRGPFDTHVRPLCCFHHVDASTSTENHPTSSLWPMQTFAFSPFRGEAPMLNQCIHGDGESEGESEGTAPETEGEAPKTHPQTPKYTNPAEVWRA
ncbi:hypothetical protein M569_17324 [Genlisea aurea]|uniref:Uncharacterized protein n=1 Tax=Genlisea aurea TaxID=192259 RepID=S8D4C0_9LAMI|nr:hypothetical protein M569_17324 [Genlisea aurea]